MAERYTSDVSDTESFCDEICNLQPYEFQPSKKKKGEDNVQSSDNEDSEFSDTSDELSDTNRSNDMSWCKCGKCESSLLVREKEYLCCHERHKTRIQAFYCEEG